jgi:hypothetical protein
MNKHLLKNIEFDLSEFYIHLYFSGKEEPLTLYFDTSSRKFYFALISLIVMEMKKKRAADFINIQSYEKILWNIDQSLSKGSKSKSPTGMFEKIRKAWRDSDRLSNLKTGKHFTPLFRSRILLRDEESKRYEYDCADSECDVWANLIRFDNTTGKKWRYKFDVYAVGLSFEQIRVHYGVYEEEEAWKHFLQQSTTFPAEDDGLSEPVTTEIEGFKKYRAVNLCKPAKLKTMCWVLKWDQHPLSKMDFKEIDGYLKITNTTNIHNHAKIIADAEIIGDFQAEIELKGKYTDIQLQAANGEDRNIYITPAAAGIDMEKPQKYIITRQGLKIDFRTQSGIPIRYGNWNARNDMLCKIAIALQNWQTVQIYSLKLRYKKIEG